MFDAVLPNGKTAVLCTPQSKYHKKLSGYWVSITLKQKCLFEEYDRGMLVLRLEGLKLTIIDWADLQPLLTKESILQFKQGKEHWVLYIFDQHV